MSQNLCRRQITVGRRQLWMVSLALAASACESGSTVTDTGDAPDVAPDPDPATPLGTATGSLSVLLPDLDVRGLVAAGGGDVILGGTTTWPEAQSGVAVRIGQEGAVKWQHRRVVPRGVHEYAEVTEGPDGGIVLWGASNAVFGVAERPLWIEAISAGGEPLWELDCDDFPAGQCARSALVRALGDGRLLVLTRVTGPDGNGGPSFRHVVSATGDVVESIALPVDFRLFDEDLAVLGDRLALVREESPTSAENLLITRVVDASTKLVWEDRLAEWPVANPLVSTLAVAADPTHGVAVLGAVREKGPGAGTRRVFVRALHADGTLRYHVELDTQAAGNSRVAFTPGGGLLVQVGGHDDGPQEGRASEHRFRLAPDGSVRWEEDRSSPPTVDQSSFVEGYGAAELDGGAVAWASRTNAAARLDLVRWSEPPSLPTEPTAWPEPVMLAVEGKPSVDDDGNLVCDAGPCKADRCFELCGVTVEVTVLGAASGFEVGPASNTSDLPRGFAIVAGNDDLLVRATPDAIPAARWSLPEGWSFRAVHGQTVLAAGPRAVALFDLSDPYEPLAPRCIALPEGDDVHWPSHTGLNEQLVMVHRLGESAGSHVAFYERGDEPVLLTTVDGPGENFIGFWGRRFAFVRDGKLGLYEIGANGEVAQIAERVFAGPPSYSVTSAAGMIFEENGAAEVPAWDLTGDLDVYGVIRRGCMLDFTPEAAGEAFALGPDLGERLPAGAEVACPKVRDLEGLTALPVEEPGGIRTARIERDHLVIADAALVTLATSPAPVAGMHHRLRPCWSDGSVLVVGGSFTTQGDGCSDVRAQVVDPQDLEHPRGVEVPGPILTTGWDGRSLFAIGLDAEECWNGGAGDTAEPTRILWRLDATATESVQELPLPELALGSLAVDGDLRVLLGADQRLRRLDEEGAVVQEAEVDIELGDQTLTASEVHGVFLRDTAGRLVWLTPELSSPRTIDACMDSVLIPSGESLVGLISAPGLAAGVRSRAFVRAHPVVTETGFELAIDATFPLAVAGASVQVGASRWWLGTDAGVFELLPAGGAP